MNDTSWLVLFAHGSSRPAWRAPLERLRDALIQRVGPTIRLAYLEQCAPALGDVCAEAAASGVERLELLPLFWSSGGHVARDLPRQIIEARARWPSVEVDVQPALGEHPLILEALVAVARSAAR